MYFPQIFLILIIPVLVTAGQLCFKKGVLDLGSFDFSLSGILSLISRILQNAWIVGGLFIFGVSFLLYLFVLSKLQLNILYPAIVSLVIILITLASWFLFKTPLSPIQVLGIILIISGIILLMFKG